MKYYFCYELDELLCFPLKTIRDALKESDDLDEVEVIEAKIVTGVGLYFCDEFRQVGETSDGYCGKSCEKYSPRNGKNGRCRHSKNTYEPTEKRKIIKL